MFEPFNVILIYQNGTQETRSLGDCFVGHDPITGLAVIYDTLFSIEVENLFLTLQNLQELKPNQKCHIGDVDEDGFCYDMDSCTSLLYIRKTNTEINVISQTFAIRYRIPREHFFDQDYVDNLGESKEAFYIEFNPRSVDSYIYGITSS